MSPGFKSQLFPSSRARLRIGATPAASNASKCSTLAATPSSPGSPHQSASALARHSESSSSARSTKSTHVPLKASKCTAGGPTRFASTTPPQKRWSISSSPVTATGRLVRSASTVVPRPPCTWLGLGLHRVRVRVRVRVWVRVSRIMVSRVRVRPPHDESVEEWEEQPEVRHLHL